MKIQKNIIDKEESILFFILTTVNWSVNEDKPAFEYEGGTYLKVIGKWLFVLIFMQWN